MPRTRRPITRRKKLTTWAKTSKQKGGFVFTIAALIAGISALVSSTAPAVATSVISAAAGYGATKLLQYVGGRKGRKMTRR